MILTELVCCAYGENVMNVEDARKLLAEAVDSEEPVVIPMSILTQLKPVFLAFWE